MRVIRVLEYVGNEKWIKETLLLSVVSPDKEFKVINGSIKEFCRCIEEE